MKGWSTRFFVAGSAMLAGLLSACGSTAPAYVAPGGVYANDWGRQLFIYRSDPGEASRYPCGPECSPAWTPLYAGIYDRAGGDFTILTRDDGNWQWAYRGQPVYFYAGRIRALAADPQMTAGLWMPIARGSRR